MLLKLQIRRLNRASKHLQADNVLGKVKVDKIKIDWQQGLKN